MEDFLLSGFSMDFDYDKPSEFFAFKSKEGNCEFRHFKCVDRDKFVKILEYLTDINFIARKAVFLLNQQFILYNAFKWKLSDIINTEYFKFFIINSNCRELEFSGKRIYCSLECSCGKICKNVFVFNK